MPAGTVTFLFTDIEGSTQLWDVASGRDARGARAPRRPAARSDRRLRNGHVFKTVGDAFCAAFAMASDAARGRRSPRSARSARRTVAASDAPIKVRMALHTGVGRATRRRLLRRGAQSRREAPCQRARRADAACRRRPASSVRDLPARPPLRSHDLGAHQAARTSRGPSRCTSCVASRILRGDFPPIKSLSTHPEQPAAINCRASSAARTADRRSRRRCLAGHRLRHAHRRRSGSGKTRLVAAGGRRVRSSSFPDGAWFDRARVHLPIRRLVTADEWRRRWASQEEPGRPITQIRSSSISSGKQLLLLSRQLRARARRVRDARRHAVGRAVSEACGSSRRAAKRSASPASTTYRVPSLSLPDRKQRPIARRRAVEPTNRCGCSSSARCSCVRDFEVTNSQTLARSHRCAATSTGFRSRSSSRRRACASLSLEEIDSKLDQRFRLLTGGSRTALPRQQTLRSLIDWSYDLLHDRRSGCCCNGWRCCAAE